MFFHRYANGAVSALPTWNGLIAILLVVLFVAYLLCRYYESGAAREFVGELQRVWKQLGIPGRIVIGTLVVMCTLHGGSKGGPPALQSLYRQLFWHADDIWALKTASDAIDANNAAVSNVVALAVETTNTVSGTEAMASTPSLWTAEFDWLMHDRVPPHDAQNVLADEPWRQDVWINGTKYHDHYIRFNAMVSTNPAIISIAYNGVNQETGEKIQLLSDVTTNSYPFTFAITRPSGVYTCYMFRCPVPLSLTNSVIAYDCEVVFGVPAGCTRGFNINGIFVVGRDGQLFIGRTYTNVVYGITNVYINGVTSKEE